jgi:cyclin B
MKYNQSDINEKMRAILLDWLVEVHLKFKLLPETLFITINIIDRYLEKRTIQRTKLQLVGITSMFIACKYEEIYAPEVKDFVFITDKAYSNKEVLEMESDILSALEFNLTMPSSFRFIEIYHYYLNYDPLVLSFIFYLLDLTVVDYRMIKYKSSLVGAAVCYVSSKLLHKENVLKNSNIDSDTERLYELSGYSEEEIKICAKDICLIYDYSDKTGLTAIKKKYSLPKFSEVAKIKFGGNK